MSDWTPVESAAKNAEGKYMVNVGGQWKPAAAVAKNAEGKYVAQLADAPTPAAQPQHSSIMGLLNAGVADIAGAPVDMVTSGMNAVARLAGGPEAMQIQHPVGGSESIQALMSKMGMASGQDVKPATSTTGRLAQESVRAAPALATGIPGAVRGVASMGRSAYDVLTGKVAGNAAEALRGSVAGSTGAAAEQTAAEAARTAGQAGTLEQRAQGEFKVGMADAQTAEQAARQQGVAQAVPELQRARELKGAAGGADTVRAKIEEEAGSAKREAQEHLTKLAPQPVADEDLGRLIQKKGSENLERLAESRRVEAIEKIQDPAFKRAEQREAAGDTLETHPESAKILKQIEDKIDEQIRATPVGARRDLQRLKAMFKGEERELTMDEIAGVGTPKPANDIVAAAFKQEPNADRAPVFIANLRKRFPNKAEFDQKVTEMVNNGEINVQTHAWPAKLTAADRENLVPNGRGGYWDTFTVAKRPESSAIAGVNEPFNLRQAEYMRRLTASPLEREKSGFATLDQHRMGEISDLVRQAMEAYEPDIGKYLSEYQKGSRAIAEAKGGTRGVSTLKTVERGGEDFNAPPQAVVGKYLDGTRASAEQLLKLTGGKEAELDAAVRGNVRQKLDGMTAQQARAWRKKNSGMLDAFPEAKEAVNRYVVAMERAERSENMVTPARKAVEANRTEAQAAQLRGSKAVEAGVKEGATAKERLEKLASTSAKDMLETAKDLRAKAAAGDKKAQAFQDFARELQDPKITPTDKVASVARDRIRKLGEDGHLTPDQRDEMLRQVTDVENAYGKAKKARQLLYALVIASGAGYETYHVARNVGGLR